MLTYSARFELFLKEVTLLGSQKAPQKGPKIAPKSPSAPQGRPKASREPPGIPGGLQGAILVSCWDPRELIWNRFGVVVGSFLGGFWEAFYIIVSIIFWSSFLDRFGDGLGAGTCH